MTPWTSRAISEVVEFGTRTGRRPTALYVGNTVYYGLLDELAPLCRFIAGPESDQPQFLGLPVFRVLNDDSHLRAA